MSSSLHSLYLAVISTLELRGFDIRPVEVLRDPGFTSAYFDHVFGVHAKQEPNPIQAELIRLGHSSMRNMMSYFFQNPTTGERCLVYFADSKETVSVGEIQDFGLLLTRTGSFNGILVSAKKLTPPSAGKIAELTLTGTYKIQHFTDSELYYNPLDSEYGSEAHLLSPEEEDAFLAELAPKETSKPEVETAIREANRRLKSQLPCVSIDDPVAKRLGAQVGQIIRYLRKTLIPGTLVKEDIFPRLVIRRPPEKKRSK